MGFQDKKIEESKTIEVIEDLVSNGQNNIISSIDKALTTEWEKVAENKKKNVEQDKELLEYEMRIKNDKRRTLDIRGGKSLIVKFKVLIKHIKEFYTK